MTIPCRRKLPEPDACVRCGADLTMGKDARCPFDPRYCSRACFSADVGDLSERCAYDVKDAATHLSYCPRCVRSHRPQEDGRPG